MNYLTYEEYLKIGGVLDSTAFNKNIDRACAFVDVNTQKRLQSVLCVSQRVKACIRDIVECFANNYSNKKTITRKSQSAGGVSESENYLTKSADDINSETSNILYDYLGTETDEYGTPLLYRGCMR